MSLKPIDISIIIPVLNESADLPELCENLAGQQGLDFEVIFCDGGSIDGSPELLRELGRCAPFTSRIVMTPRGRGRQMNSGAEVSRGDLLLFLHADSRFDHPHALQTALTAYRQMKPSESVAARFRLRFRRRETTPSLAYFFYESKASLERIDCVRGDQGFLISRSFFNRLGGFDTSLPFLEDLRLAEMVEQGGTWQLLPTVISTSARRFETEGLYERQVINAIITAAVAAGWHELLEAMPGLYRSSCSSNRLRLHPLLEGIRTLIAGRDRSWRRSFWRRTGRHVAGNAWQLFFWLDVRHAFRVGAADVTPRWYGLYNRNLKALFESPAAGLLGQLLTKVWFRCMLRFTRG